MPDIGDRIRFAFDGLDVQGGGFLQSYALQGAVERGRFADGRIAIAENRFGKGKTLLIGTNPSIGYFRTSSDAGRRLFDEVFAFTGRKAVARANNPAVQVRVHEGGGKRYLWLVNSTRQVQTGHIELGAGAVKAGATYWAGEGAQFDGRRFAVPGRDVLIVEIG